MDWTPIGEGLPPIGYPLIVTIYDTCHSRRELRYPVYYRQRMYEDGWGFYDYNENYLMPEFSEVLAWMKLPNVYEGEA